jgi:hypothetical protein
MQLTDQDILLRLGNTEDSFVERKTQNDVRDCLKTVVAFANTTPIGYPAILFVGVRDDGEIEGVSNPDNIQKSVSERIAVAYPTIYTTTHVLTKDGKQFLAVVIPGSENRPHFSGPAYVRDGSQSLVASEKQFDILVAQRNGKAYVIQKWVGERITVAIELNNPEMAKTSSTLVTLIKRFPATVFECNQFYVALQTTESNSDRMAIPLRLIDVSFDYKNRRLELCGWKLNSLPFVFQRIEHVAEA